MLEINKLFWTTLLLCVFAQLSSHQPELSQVMRWPCKYFFFSSFLWSFSRGLLQATLVGKIDVKLHYCWLVVNEFNTFSVQHMRRGEVWRLNSNAPHKRAHFCTQVWAVWYTQEQQHGKSKPNNEMWLSLVRFFIYIKQKATASSSSQQAEMCVIVRISFIE